MHTRSRGGGGEVEVPGRLSKGWDQEGMTPRAEAWRRRQSRIRRSRVGGRGIWDQGGDLDGGKYTLLNKACILVIP